MEPNLKAFAEQRKPSKKTKSQHTKRDKIFANKATNKGFISKVYKLLR